MMVKGVSDFRCQGVPGKHIYGSRIKDNGTWFVG